MPEPIYRDIGRIVRTLRRRTERGQEELAQQLGISRATLANIETGRQRILVHQLYAMAKALDVTLNDLLPAPRQEESSTDLAGMRIEGDLNEEQTSQVINLMKTIETPPRRKAEGTDGKTRKTIDRGASRKPSR